MTDVDRVWEYESYSNGLWEYELWVVEESDRGLYHTLEQAQEAATQDALACDPEAVLGEWVEWHEWGSGYRRDCRLLGRPRRQYVFSRQVHGERPRSAGQEG